MSAAKSINIVSPIRFLRNTAKKNPIQPVGRKFLVCLVLASVGVNTSSLAMEVMASPMRSAPVALSLSTRGNIRGSGTMQYPETLPLDDHEVVITFDDGPSARYTDRILEILASECVKATFFMVGEMAKTFPDEAKKVEAEGHTIGTHSFRHPFTFGRMTESQAGQEIDEGIAAVGAALGNSEGLLLFSGCRAC